MFPVRGLFAYQDVPGERGLLLLVDNGIFYEFIKADNFRVKNPKRYTLAQVELGINYVLILSTTAGLWGYNIGDTVKFVCLSPFRIVVTGRIKHYISAFGEHVIGKEVETAMEEVCKSTAIRVKEFNVSPQIYHKDGLHFNEWLIEY